MQRRAILGELAWLVYFILLLVAGVYTITMLADALAPRHFNATIADAIGALLAAVAFVATRRAMTRRR